MSSAYTTCAACKFLRRKCAEDCIFYPYFPPDNPKRFASVHKAFGAHNVAKLLSELHPSQREEAINSLFYEAEARLNDPIYGCVGLVSILQYKLNEIQTSLSSAKNELATFIGPEAVDSIIQQFILHRQKVGNRSSSARRQHNKMPMMGIPKAAVPATRGGQLVIRETQQQQQEDILRFKPEQQQHHQEKQKGIMMFDTEKQQHQGKQKGILSFNSELQQQMFDAQQLTAGVAAARGEQDMFRGYERQHHQRQQPQQMYDTHQLTTAVVAAREQEDILRGYEQQHHRGQWHDILTFNNEEILKLDSAPQQQQRLMYDAQQLTAVVVAAREQEDMVRGYEKQHYRGQRHDILTFNNEDILRLDSEQKQHNQQEEHDDNLTFKCEDILSLISEQPQHHQGQQQDILRLFKETGSATATGFDQMTTEPTMCSSLALRGFDDPYQIQTQQKDQPHGFDQMTTEPTLSSLLALWSFDNPYQIQSQLQDHPHYSQTGHPQQDHPHHSQAGHPLQDHPHHSRAGHPLQTQLLLQAQQQEQINQQQQTEQKQPQQPGN